MTKSSPTYQLIEASPGSKGGVELRGAAKQLWSCRDYEVIIEGPSETGKTIGALNKLHALACKYPGAQSVIVRKTYASTVASVIQTYLHKVLPKPARDVITIYGKEHPEWFGYPNESRIWVSGLDNPDKILSTEWDFIYVNQAEELSLQDWEMLGSRCTGRAGHTPYSQLIGDCNPGPPTHWIKTRAASGKLTLLHSRHQDNPTLYDAEANITERGRISLERLGNMTGARRLRLYLGLWAQPEGAIYDVFVEEKHKVASFTPDRLWPRVVGIDPMGAYVVALWLAFDSKAGIVNVYREYYEPFGVTTPQHARNILERSAGETIFAWVGGGPSERQARLDWQAAGIPMLESPVTEVWAGIDRVYQLLKEFRLVIHDCCINLLAEIGAYSRKLDNGAPTDVILDKEKYHCLDALRYCVSWLTGPVEQQQVVYNPVRIWS